MTFTYGGDPQTSDVDAVRFLVGDTDAELPFLQDEEIRWVINTWKHKGSVYYYAAKAADSISAKVAREVSINSDGQSFGLSELQQRFSQLAIDLYRQYEDLLASGVSVSAGGFLVGEQRDPNVLPLAFGTRMHDNYRAGRQDFGDEDYPEDYSQWGEQVP